MPTSSSPKKPLPPVFSNMPARVNEFQVHLLEARDLYGVHLSRICPDHMYPCGHPAQCQNVNIYNRGKN